MSKVIVMLILLAFKDGSLDSDAFVRDAAQGATMENCKDAASGVKNYFAAAYDEQLKDGENSVSIYCFEMADPRPLAGSI